MGYYRQAGDFYRGARGDFYRGARGDIFGDIGSFFKDTALPLANKLFGPAGIMTGARIATGQQSPFSAIAGLLPGGAAQATSPGQSMTSMVPFMGGGTVAGLARKVLPAAGTLVTRGIVGSAKALGAAGRQLMLPEPGMRFRRRSRRINPLNPRALRRALRRAKGFEHFAKSVMKFTSPNRRPHGFKFTRKRKRA
jgi:hypothetical protein